MGTINRGTKSAGGTDFSTGDIIASEVNTDLNTAFTEINGQLGDANIVAAANIDPSKIGDYSATDAESRTSTSPDGSAAPNKAGTLEAEIARIRRQVMRAGVGESALRNNGDASADEASWQDPPRIGPNLLYNAALTGRDSTNLPAGWTNVSTATLADGTADASLGDFLPLKITAAGSTNEGISQTVDGLKASTYYLVGAMFEATAGDTASLDTTGATGTDFGNLTLDSTATSFALVSGVILTDATPTNIVVQLLAAADTDVIEVAFPFMYELNVDPVALPRKVTVRLASSNRTTGELTTTRATVQLDTTGDNAGDTDMSFVVVPPGPGYYITAEATVNFGADSAADMACAIEIEENGTVKAGVEGLADSGDGSSLYAKYTNTAPTPGTAYTYVVKGDSGVTGSVNRGALGGSTNVSFLEVTMEHVG